MTSSGTFPGPGPYDAKGLVYSAPIAPRRSDQTPAVAGRGRISTVLLATDLTAASEDATLQAIDLAASVEARLLIVNVIDPSARKAGVVDDVVGDAAE